MTGLWERRRMSLPPRLHPLLAPVRPKRFGEVGVGSGRWGVRGSDCHPVNGWRSVMKCYFWRGKMVIDDDVLSGKGMEALMSRRQKWPRSESNL